MVLDVRGAIITDNKLTHSIETTLPHNLSRVTRAVIFSQMLFTAGHSLTTGGFLYYFAYSFSPSAAMLALLQIAPETSEAFSFISQSLINRFQTRKWLWISCVIFGRLIALLIPACLLFSDSPHIALGLMLASLLFWHLLQGIGYCAYLSWLSLLVPEMNWGAFFAKRKIASLLISIIVPTAAGLTKQYWIKYLPADKKNWSFAVIFATGALLVMASIWPMLWLPDRKARTRTQPAQQRTTAFSSLSRSFRWLLASRWWLSFFQGLTQAVIFKFSVDYLKIGLEEYYVLAALMLTLQIFTSYLGGRLCDRGLEKKLLIASLFAVSFAMWFWIQARPDAKWLAAGAYALWGGFGFVNIAYQNLTLKLAPHGENALHVSLSRQSSGFLAGVAGILGGLALEALLRKDGWSTLNAFQYLFLISWVGRATACCWLIPLRQPTLRRVDSGQSSS